MHFLRDVFSEIRQGQGVQFVHGHTYVYYISFLSVCARLCRSVPLFAIDCAYVHEFVCLRGRGVRASVCTGGLAGLAIICGIWKRFWVS